MFGWVVRKNLLGNRLLSYSVLRNFPSHFSSTTDDQQKKPVRVPWHEQEGEWYSSFKVFASEKKKGPDFITLMQKPIDISLPAIKRWWLNKKEWAAIYDQRYIPCRHDMLGNDLASAHFVVHRGGSVKFVGRSAWVKKDKEGNYNLPGRIVPGFFVEAIDASNMPIYYEGLRNIFGLKQLKWLSFNNCPQFDDWCMDRICGEYMTTLEYLDIGNCHKVSDRGLCAVYKLEKLQTLKVHNIRKSKVFELTCLTLEDIMPNLKVEGIEY